MIYEALLASLVLTPTTAAVDGVYSVVVHGSLVLFGALNDMLCRAQMIFKLAETTPVDSENPFDPVCR